MTLHIMIPSTLPAPIPRQPRRRRSSAAPQYQPGDIITFRRDDGWNSMLTILGYREDGDVDVLFYNGQPHHMLMTVADLAALRVVEIQWMAIEDVNEYRNMFGLMEMPDERPASCPEYTGTGLYSFGGRLGAYLLKARWRADLGLFELAECWSDRLRYVLPSQFSAQVLGRAR